MGTVNSITCYGREVSYETCPQSLVIEVNKTFKGVPAKTYNIGLGLNGSCDSGNFHPFKSIKLNGSTRKVTDYQVGQEYLFVIYQRKRDEKSYYYVRAGEILGSNTLPYISMYTEYNTANKPINQDK